MMTTAVAPTGAAPPPTRPAKNGRRKGMKSHYPSWFYIPAGVLFVIFFAVPTFVAPAPAPTSVASTPGRSVALKQVIPSSLQASIRVVSEGWGTRIDMDCTYGLPAPGDGGAQPHSFDYGMYVTDARGHSVEIATWTAGPGTAAQLSGTTKLALDQITSVDVRSSDGTVLLNTSL
jgi:hypothetical protein